MKPLAIPSQNEVRSLVSYDMETGVFIWLVPPTGRGGGRRIAEAGEPAGRLDKDGYLIVSLNGNTVSLQRLAWRYVTGEWPKETIDHRDGVRSNNKWANLRKATISQNIANSKICKRNRSGVKGVSWHALGKKWQASIYFSGKSRGLGLFDCPRRRPFCLPDGRVEGLRGVRPRSVA